MSGQVQVDVKIQEHRRRIDGIDGALVGLLNERAQEALQIRSLKAESGLGLFDPKREEDIFEAVCAANEGPLYNENLREIYEAILKVMKEVPTA